MEKLVRMLITFSCIVILFLDFGADYEIFLHLSINVSSIQTVLGICEKAWSSQIHDIVLSANAHIIWVIWYDKNQTCFNNVSVLFSRDLQFIFDVVSLFGHNSTGINSNSIDEFRFLKHFSMLGHPSKAPSIIEVSQNKPLC